MKYTRFLVFSILIFSLTLLSGCALTSSPTKTNPTAPVSSSTPQIEDTATQAATPTQAAAVTGGCVNAYYPVTLGSTWSYSSSGGNLGSYTYTRTVQSVDDTGFTTNDAYSTGVNWQAKWKCQDGKLSSLDAGPTSAFFSTGSYAFTSNSVTTDGYRIPAKFDNSTSWSEKVTIDGTVTSSASTSKTMNSEIAYAIDCKAGGTDSVTVPAGTFDTVKATCTQKVTVSATVQGNTMQLGTNQEEVTFWYAKGVGFLKSVATGGSNNETVVLTQYKIQ